MKKLMLGLCLVSMLSLPVMAAQMVNIDAVNVSTAETPAIATADVREGVTGDVTAYSVKASCEMVWKLRTTAGYGLSQNAARDITPWYTNTGVTVFITNEDASSTRLYGDRVVLETKSAATNVNTIAVRLLVE